MPAALVFKLITGASQQPFNISFRPENFLWKDTGAKGRWSSIYTLLPADMMKIPQSENQYVEFKSERVAAKNLAEEIVYDLIQLSEGSISHLDLSAIADYFSRYKISFGAEHEDEKIRLLKPAMFWE